MYKAVIAVAGALAIGGIAGCGGDDTTTSTTPTSTTSSTVAPSGATGAQAGSTITADELVSCLGDTGIESSVSPNTLAGVDGDYKVVQDESGNDVAAVFTDGADAQGQETALDLYIKNGKLFDNVYYGTDDKDMTQAIEVCLPSG